MSRPKSSPVDMNSPPRNLEFARGRADAEAWHVDGRDASAVYGALSLMFPDGERFFIEAVKHFRTRATGKLAQDLKDFIAQEALHTREHLRFNRLLVPSTELNARVDLLVQTRLAEIRARGPAAMLVATVCLEHLTAVFADDIMREPSLMASPDADITNLWQWHALEEAEHKGVAFDLFQIVGAKWGQGRRYRIRAMNMVLVTSLFLWNWATLSLWLMELSGVTGLTARIRLLCVWFGRRGLLRRSIGGYLQWFRPGFHPWDHDNRALIAVYREKFAAAYLTLTAAA